MSDNRQRLLSEGQGNLGFRARVICPDLIFEGQAIVGPVSLYAEPISEEMGFDICSRNFKTIGGIELEGFVFPDDLRFGNVILVADEFEAEKVLRAFQELGWHWGDGRNPLDTDVIPNIRGISVWDNERIGYCNKLVSDEELSEMYSKVIKASNIFPSLNLAFDFSILRQGDVIEVHSLEETKSLLAAFEREGWRWSSGLDIFVFEDGRLAKIGGIAIDSLCGKRLAYWQKGNRQEMFKRHPRVLNYSFLLVNPDDIADGDFSYDDLPDVDLSDFLG